MKKKWLVLSSLCLSFFLLVFLFLFATDKGYDIRKFLAETILSTQHREWAKWTFLPQSELDAILHNLQNPAYSNTIVSPTLKDKKANSTGQSYPAKGDDLVVTVTDIDVNNGPTSYYKGKLLSISNPHNVQLVNSSVDGSGEQIFVQAAKHGAIAATNASGFYDPEGIGNGGIALGIVIEEAVITASGGNKEHFVGALTEKGQLLTGKYKAKDLLDMDVVSAAGFKPQLIGNGKKMITDGDGGWGAGPRTAMGQKADGTILLVVIDGRQLHSIGATIRDVQDILYEAGAINAVAMDGGSSASMYFNGENVTTPSSVGNVPRYLPNIWAVIPEEGQSVTVIDNGQTVMKEKHYRKN